VSEAGVRVGLIGATGAVGTELVGLLGEHRLRVAELRAFAGPDSEGEELDFAGDLVYIERLEPARVASCDLVFCAASRALEKLLPSLRESGTRVVDLSGALELDTDVPLALPGDPVTGPWVAVPRGIAVGLGLTLRALAAETGLKRVTVLTLESATGAGRHGVDEFADQTLSLLNAMTGEAGDPEVFPRPLAFDCLPQVGDPLEGDETSEERRLQHVLRRLLDLPGLPVEVSRVRVPVFSGSLAVVHVETDKELSAARARELFGATGSLEVFAEGDLPTPRRASGTDDVLVGRIRWDERAGSLGFVVALDELRLGSALGAIEAAVSLLGE